MHIIELLKNVAYRVKSDHRFGISATNLVNYIEFEPLFEALLNNFDYFQIRCIWIYSTYEYIIQKLQFLQ